MHTIHMEGRNCWGISLETTSHILDGNTPAKNQVCVAMKGREKIDNGSVAPGGGCYPPGASLL